MGNYCMESQKKVVIIGGGVVGLCSAYYLHAAGHHVVVLERSSKDDKKGCSFGNAGYVCPSHFVPLAAPGMINKGLMWMLDPESPFYVRPRFNKELLNWLIEFKKATGLNRVEKAIPALKDLGVLSRELFSELESSLDFSLETKGLIMMCQDQKTLDKEAALAVRAKELGLEAKVLSSEDISKLQPKLLFSGAGGVLYPGDAHLTPIQLMKALREDLCDKGVVFVNDVEATGFEINGDKLTAVLTTNGKYMADDFVLTAGSWSPLLAKELGINLPIQVGKGYSLTVEGMGELLDVPGILVEGKVAVTPMENDLRFAGTMEIVGYENRINSKRISGMIKTIVKSYPQIDIERIKNTLPWFGFRPCSPDGLPYIGRFNRYSNLIAATGHAMLGVSLSAATGKLVGEIVSHRTSSVALELFAPDRYNR